LQPEKEGGLVDLVDRLLNKGLILNADVIITVAGIPMVGLSLKAALASIETMLDYGMMEAWDKSTRDWYSREFTRTSMPLAEGEEVAFKSFGYLWQSEGICQSWVPGLWHITNSRIFLWRREPAGMIIELPIDSIDGITERQEQVFGAQRTEFDLYFGHKSVRIYLSEGQEFKSVLERTAGNLRAIKV